MSEKDEKDKKDESVEEGKEKTPEVDKKVGIVGQAPKMIDRDEVYVH